MSAIKQDVELNVKIVGQKDVDALEKQLATISQLAIKVGDPHTSKAQKNAAANALKIITGGNAKKFIADLTAQKTMLEELRDLFERVGSGAKFGKKTAADKKKLDDYIKAQYNAYRDSWEKATRQKDYINKVLKGEEYKKRLSGYMRMGYAPGEASHLASLGEEGQTQVRDEIAAKYAQMKRQAQPITNIYDLWDRIDPRKTYTKVGDVHAANAAKAEREALQLTMEDPQKYASKIKSLKEKAAAESSAADAAYKAAGKWAIILATTMFVVDSVKKLWRKFNSDMKETMGFSFSIKDNFQDIRQVMGEMLNSKTGMATFGQGTSLIANSQARELQMRYGLTSGQTYAMSQTMGTLNMTEEDLMWMNPSQRQLFGDLMQKYSSWYDELQSSGVLQTVQEMQLEFTLFKQEIAADFLKWMSENKSTILTTLKGLLKMTEHIITLLAKVFSFFGVSVDTSAAADTRVRRKRRDAGN